MKRSRHRASRSASASVSAQSANTATLAWGAARRTEGRKLSRSKRVASTPPTALMKCAQENAVPKCAASAAPVAARAQDPDGGRGGPRRHRAHAAVGMPVGELVVEHHAPRADADARGTRGEQA